MKPIDALIKSILYYEKETGTIVNSIEIMDRHTIDTNGSRETIAIHLKMDVESE